MGKQIGFAYLPEEEALIVTRIRSFVDLYCVPRIMYKIPSQPELLKSEVATDFKIFPAEYVENAIEDIVPVVGTTEQFHLFPKANYCIEWIKPVAYGNDFAPGRFYLDTGGVFTDAPNKNILKIFNTISSIVKKSFTSISAEKRTYYLSEGLSQKMSLGEATFLGECSFQPNQHFRER